MASVDSLTFDLADCELVQQAEAERIWVNPDHVAHRLKFDTGVIYWPFDLTDPDAARAFYRRECELNRGVMLEMEPVTAAGVEGLAGVFKYRSPIPGSLGMAYVGILWLPFRDCRFQVNVEAVEQGTTGMREAAVMVIEGDKWPMEPQAEIPVINSQEELDALYAKAREKPLKRLPSDDPKYDASFPQHPLSLVRAGLARVIASARLGSDARGLQPHRVSR
jgi:hypothetical protein